MAVEKKIAQSSTRQEQSKYQWPATKLTGSDMAILYNWRKKTGTPIDLLLAQAVREVHRIIQRR